jgi:hypothetical protein
VKFIVDEIFAPAWEPSSLAIVVTKKDVDNETAQGMWTRELKAVLKKSRVEQKRVEYNTVLLANRGSNFSV